MTEVCSKPVSNHQIDAHIWIGAFAVAQIVIALALLDRIDSLGGAVDIAGLAYEKLNSQVASLQGEIATLRHQNLDAPKADATKKGSPNVPGASEPAAAPPHGRTRN